MVTMNGTQDAAPVPAPADAGALAVAKHRIPGAQHADDLTLGGATVHLAVHTGAGIRHFQAMMGQPHYERFWGFGPGVGDALSDADYAAQTLVAGAIGCDDFATLAELLTYLLVNPVSEIEAAEASPEELVLILKTFLSKGGLAYLTRILKNLMASRTVGAMIALAATQTQTETDTETDGETDGETAAAPETDTTPPVTATVDASASDPTRTPSDGSATAISGPSTAPAGTANPSTSGTSSPPTSPARPRARRTRS